MLEHIQRLAPVFGEAARVLRPGGWLWTSELHPYRQWRGAQAHFRDAEGCLHIPDCYPHSFSDYLRAARARGGDTEQVHVCLCQRAPKLNERRPADET